MNEGVSEKCLVFGFDEVGNFIRCLIGHAYHPGKRHKDIAPGVNDIFAGISGEMLINAITFNLSVNEGSTTELSLIEKNAYQLTLEEPKAQTYGFSLT